MSRPLAVIAALSLAQACSSSQPGEGTAPPAKVTMPVSEAELNSVTLTTEAEARLAVQTTAVEERMVHQTRNVGGEIVAPPGRTVTVSAPLAGTVLAPAPAAVPAAGAAVKKGQAILRLRPLPGAMDLAAAQERLAAARARARRAEQLLEAGAISARALEDAHAELAAAESGVKALSPAADVGDGDVLVLSSPQDGVVSRLYVASGQSVATATSLFEIVPRNRMWVRVPLYVGDLPAVDSTLGVVVRALGDPPGGAGRLARAVPGPPMADAQAATGDLFFAFEGDNGGDAGRAGDLRPGERVLVELRLRQAEAARVVPWSAVVFDFNGGAWVYESTAPHVFVRRRVEVRRVEGDLAVLSGGPARGRRVVSQGAAELFGTELGNGK